MSRSSVPPSVRIQTARNSLQPSEERVAELVLAEPAVVVELTAQELADRVGVSRSSVIRACQTFGYRGYPQLRVAIAAELGQASAQAEYGDSALGGMRSAIDRLVQSLPQALSLLDETTVDVVTARIAAATRVLVVANGLSSPIASDLSMRLTGVGRPAEFVHDGIAQQIAASGLRAGDMCLVISGSGSNEASLRAASAAQGRATIVAVTSFASSPLTAVADHTLVVVPAGVSFRDELEHTSRVAHAVFVEVLVAAVASAMGESSRTAHARVLDILSDNLADNVADEAGAADDG